MIATPSPILAITRARRAANSSDGKTSGPVKTGCAKTVDARKRSPVRRVSGLPKRAQLAVSMLFIKSSERLIDGRALLTERPGTVLRHVKTVFQANSELAVD